MGKSSLSQGDYLEAVIKTCQYLAALISDREVWVELEKVLTHYFKTDLVAFIGRRPDGEIVLHHCHFNTGTAGDRLLQGTAGLVSEVLESGFLAAELLALPEPYAVAVLPIVEGKHLNRVMLVAHRTTEPLPRSLLDIYLAVAGLCGAALERLSSERRVRRMTEKVPEMLFELLVYPDGSLQFTFVSPQSSKIFGHSPDALLDDAGLILSTMHPDDRARFAAALTGATGDGVHLSQEVRRLEADGRERHILFHALSSLKEGGVAAWDGSFLDITAHKQSEAELERLRGQNELILACAGEGIYGIDLEGRITFVNPATVRMVGWEPEELIGRHLHDILHHTTASGAPHPGENCQIYAASRDGKIHHVDDEIFWKKDGASFPVEYTSTPIRDKNGEVLGSVVVFRDITERRRAKEALEESEKNLRFLASQLLAAQEQERKRISRELHDDLGQALLVLKMKLHMVEKELSYFESAGPREGCLACLDYLSGIIENARRISRDLTPIILEDLGLTSAIKHLLEEFVEHRKIKDYSLRVVEVDDLFAPEAQLNLYRIFQESLTNIAKYAGASRLAAAIHRESGHVTFMVEDNGVGFDVEEVGSREVCKKGLGLASIKERVRMLGGSLSLDSQKGLGTRITFTVPVTEVPADQGGQS